MLIALKRDNREKQNYHFWLKKPVHFREVLRCHGDPKKAKKPLHFREEVVCQNFTIQFQKGLNWVSIGQFYALIKIA